MTGYHLVARAWKPFRPFADPGAARWMWAELQAAFPEAMGASLMPNHLHLQTGDEDTQWLSLRLRRSLDRFCREHGVDGPLWEPVPAPELIVGADKMARQVRYVLINPCRARLCGDPLEWPWSTHRDVVGAVADPWISSGRLLSALEAGHRGVDWLHAYVSGDPSVAVVGTPMPTPAPPRSLPALGLELLAHASAAATRAAPRDIRRRGPTRDCFAHLCWHQGWKDPAVVGAACGVEPQAVRRLLRRPFAGFDAALLCLGDERLRKPMPVLGGVRWPRLQRS